MATINPKDIDVHPGWHTKAQPWQWFMRELAEFATQQLEQKQRINDSPDLEFASGTYTGDDTFPYSSSQNVTSPGFAVTYLLVYMDRGGGTIQFYLFVDLNSSDSDMSFPFPGGPVAFNDTAFKQISTGFNVSGGLWNNNGDVGTWMAFS